MPLPVTDIKATALAVIINEAAAINNLQHYITPEVCDIIMRLRHNKGRLIITGIGKSAIIAQKIVATINSTTGGCHYMHTADALHGDVGMVYTTDVVMIISKSGESPEIIALAKSLKNKCFYTIAMVGNINSTLATTCDFIINTTIEREACPLNLAPTTSTTAQLVMGDVIAVCLMKLWGTTNESFARNHPAGALGKKLLLTIAHVTNTNNTPRVSITDNLPAILLSISQGRLGATAVVDDSGKVTGIITDGDIRRILQKNNTNMAQAITTLTAADITSSKPKTIQQNELATQALLQMQTLGITQLIVLNQNAYVGMVHLHDLIKEGLIIDSE